MKSAIQVTGFASVEDTRGLKAQVENRSLPLLKSGLVAALVANVLWGTSFLASKYTLMSWGPFTASALRFLLATGLMFAGMKIFKRRIKVPQTSREWLGILTVAVAGFGVLYPLQLAGLKLITSGMSAAIMLTSPLFVVIAGRLFLAETLTVRKLVAIGLGIAGGALLLSTKGALSLGVSRDFFVGAALTGLASLCLALSVIATRKVSKSFDSGSLTLWSMAIGFVLLAVSAQAFEHENVFFAIQRGTQSSWTALIFLAVVCSAFCFFIWNYALSKASPKEIASTMHIKTPTAVLLGVTLAGESLNLPLIAGTAIVMTGVWFSQTTPKGTQK
jgi:drug/metabolite transporter (DMT)-like permease